MKRPLVWCTIFYMAGILTAGKYAYILLPVIFIISSGFTYTAFKIFHKRKKPGIIVLTLFFAGGFFNYSLTTHMLESKYSLFAGKEPAVYGVVADEPISSDTGIAYIIRTTQIEMSGRRYKISGRLQITVNSGSEAKCGYGSRIKASGILSMPKALRNPGGFNYRRYLQGKKISALMYSTGITVTDNDPGISIKGVALTVRRRIINVINACLPKKEAGLLNGMLIGFRDGLDENMQQDFRDTGLTHIMAVSGANVVFIALPFAVIFKKMRLKPLVSNILIAVILIFFVFITGFSASVVRAVIMALVVLGGKILYRETEVITSIAFSALLLLLYNSVLIYDIGFQLSFAATLSLVFFYNPIKNRLNFSFIPAAVADISAATIAAQVGVLPVSTCYFNQISLISVAANLLVIPLVEAVTILGTVMAVSGQFSMFLAKIPALLNYLPLAFIIKVTGFCSNIPFAAITVPTPGLFPILSYYFAVVYIFLIAPAVQIKLKIRHIAAAVLIISVVTVIPGKLEMLFIDVGEGDAILITTPAGRNILVDGGGKLTGKGGEGTGSRIIIPLLLDYGIRKLDLVIATHPHGDHIQGLYPVIEQVSVKEIILPDDELVRNDFAEIKKLADKKAIPVSYCKKGDTVLLDRNINASVLNPDKSRLLSASAANNASLVLKLTYGNIKILLTGDIEKDAEAQLLDSKVDLSANFLKIAHHGSDTSTTASFLDKVNPDAAVISVGSNNFGHPSPIVNKRIEASGAGLYRTDLNGAVKVVTDGHKISVFTLIKPHRQGEEARK